MNDNAPLADLDPIFGIEDASTKRQTGVRIRPDRHGFSVTFENAEEGILVDCADGAVRVFKTDAFGEADPNEVLSIPIEK